MAATKDNPATEHRTLCNRDCPDVCGILATKRDGQIVGLRGDPSHPITQGFLCYRTNQFLHRHRDPKRLTQPLFRPHLDAPFEAVSWDWILDHLASHLTELREKHGPESVFHYRSGGTMGLATAEASDLFFERWGPVTIKEGDICSGAGEAAQTMDFGCSDSNDLHDLLNAKQIIVWGRNVHTCSPHLLPILKQAQRAGTQLLMIDPVRHRGADLCGSYLQPRPGGDFALAMAAARLLFEEDRLDPQAADYCHGLDGFRTLCHTRTLAAWCAAADVTLHEARDLAARLSSGPCTILVGWGMSRRSHGGSIVRALDALGAVTGNVGTPGGGVSFYYQRRAAFRKLSQGLAARRISEPCLGPELLAANPPVRALWVTAGNPVAMLPESESIAAALRRLDLVCVVDSWLSDTCDFAHVVLPTTNLLESDDLLGSYGHHFVGKANPVAAPPGQCRSDYAIFQALAQRLGVAGLEDPLPLFQEKLLGPELLAAGTGPKELQTVQRNPTAPRVVFAERRFATPSGKVELIHEAPATPPPPAGAFPMLLLALSTPDSQSSQWVKQPPERMPVTVHPDRSPVAEGQCAWLESRLGKLLVEVRFDARQRRDVCLMPKGGPFRNRRSANQLTEAKLTDLGHGAALYEQPVRLVPDTATAQAVAAPSASTTKAEGSS